MANLMEFIKNEPIQRVVIGGHKMLFHDVYKYLPGSLKKKVAGTFVTQLNIPKNQLIKHAQLAVAKFS